MKNTSDNFRISAESLEKKIKEIFFRLVKFGYEETKTKVNYKINGKWSVHASFSEETIKIMKECLKHRDIKRIMTNFQRKDFEKKETNVLMINKKEVIVIGVEGLALLGYLVSRVCRKIEDNLMDPERKILRRLKKDIRASFKKISFIDRISVEIKSFKDNENNENRITAEIIVKKNKEKYEAFLEKAKFFVPNVIAFSEPTTGKIISQINKYAEEIKKREANIKQ